MSKSDNTSAENDPMSAMLNMRTSLVAKVVLIDEKLRTLSGTMSARIKRAELSTLGESIPAELLPNLTEPFSLLWTEEHAAEWGEEYVVPTWADYAATVESILSTATLLFERARDEKLASADSESAERDALYAERDTLAIQVDALNVTLGMFDVESIELSKRPGKRSGGTQSSKSLAGTFSFWVGGEKDNAVRTPAASQQSLSAVAFYHGAALLGVEGKSEKAPRAVDVAVLKSALTERGWDGMLTESFSFDLPCGALAYDVSTPSEQDAEQE